MKKTILLLLLLIFSGCSNAPKDFERLKSEGYQDFIKGEYQTALTSFHAALRIKQSDKEILMLIGQTFIKNGQLDSALFYYKRSDLLYPYDNEINQTIYDLAINLEEYQYALNALYALISSGAQEVNLLEQLAELNLRLGFGEKAYFYYNKLLTNNPENPNYYLILSNIASHIEDSVSVSVRIIDQAIEKFGPREELLVNKAIYLAGLRKYSEAEKIFRNQMKNSENPQTLKLNLANVLSLQDSRSKKLEALKLYREIRDSGADMIPIIDSTIEKLEQELK